MKKRMLSLLLALGMGLSLAACGETAQQSPRRGRQLGRVLVPLRQ